MSQNLEYVCQMFSWIELQSGRKLKESGLKTLRDSNPEISQMAQDLLSVALDWYKHYNIATLPEVDPTACKDEADLSLFLWWVEKFRVTRFSDTETYMNMLQAYPYQVAIWLRRCLLKDLKMGVQETTVNKIWPGLIKTFECALANSLTEEQIVNLKYPLFADPKIDGVRAVCILKESEDGSHPTPAFCSRSGKQLFNVETMAKEIAVDVSLLGFKGSWVLDGELFHTDFRTTAGLVRASVNPPSPEVLKGLYFHVFDMIPLHEWEGVPTTPFHERRSNLTKFIARPSWDYSPIRAVHQATIHSPEELTSFYTRILKEGYEGIMVKDPHAPYSFGRSDAMLKYKPFDVDVFQIVSFYEGEGRHVGRLGGFVVDAGKGVTCNVGGGFTDAQRQLYWDNRNKLYGVKIQVKYKERTPDGSLREPVFISVEE